MGNMTSMVHFGLLDCDFSGQIPVTFSNLINLQSLTLANNRLTGPFPQFLAQINSIVNIQLQDNLLTGSLPSFELKADTLDVLQLQNNLFSGNLDFVFSTPGSTTFTDLNTLDLSENMLTGSIPSSLFDITSLENLALSSNCFSGTFPSNLCNLQQIRMMSLNGLSSSSKCEDHGTFLRMFLGDFVRGEIPACVFQLPLLDSLYVTGNQLSGELADLTSPSAFRNLALSYNRLWGSVPQSIQQHPFSLLDIGHNAFKGEISVINGKTNELTAAFNRLSGRLPKSFSNSIVLNILSGNKFDCNDIPDEDQDSSTYECGSNHLDNAMVFVGVCIFCWIVACSIILINWKWPKVHVFNMRYFVQYYLFFLSMQCIEPKSPNILRFEWLLKKSVSYMIWLSAWGVVAAVPVLLYKFDGSSTYEQSYSWVYSLAYSSGTIVAVVIVLAWLCLLMMGTLFKREVDKAREKLFRNSEDEFNAVENCENMDEVSFHVTVFNVPINMKRWQYQFLFLVINFSVILGANALYTYFLFLDFSTEVTTCVQISFGLFLKFWQHGVMGRFLFNPSHSISHRVLIRTLMGIFMSVIAPCVVLLITSADCLRVRLFRHYH